MKDFLLAKKYWLLLGVLIALGVWLFVSFPSETVPEGIEIAPVTKGEVVEVVSETGVVLPVLSVDLAFERGGKVSEIFFTTGQEVQAGEVLLQLEAGQAAADLAVAYARLEAEEIRLAELQTGADSTSLAVTEASVKAATVTLENAERNLKEVRAQQDQLVQNAEKTLRSSSLQAYLVSGERENSDDSYAAPTITGTYNGTEEGIYRLELYASGALSGASLNFSGLEKGIVPVSTVNPVALGTRGLFVQFPTDFARRTTWEVPVPNTRSSSYLANLNTYNSVLDARQVALTNAENAVALAKAALAQSQTQYTQVSGSARVERIVAQRALVKQMQAAVASAEVAYANTVIKAPFAGVVTNVSPQVGEIVSPATPVVSVMSGDNFELLVNISESDIKEVTVGDTATITLDAYDDLALAAMVTQVAPSASLVEGVRVFEVRLRLAEESELIRSGLSADIDILAAKQSEVLVVPTRAVVEDESGKFVRSFKQGKIEHLPVQVGLRGSNGLTEIVSGLTEGQSIVTFADRDALELLEAL